MSSILRKNAGFVESIYNRNARRDANEANATGRSRSSRQEQESLVNYHLTVLSYHFRKLRGLIRQFIPVKVIDQ